MFLTVRREALRKIAWSAGLQACRRGGRKYPHDILRALGVLGVLGGFPALVSGQFQMPDPKQMAGIPRPVTDLPKGTVSVRLIRGQLSNNITNFPVDLQIGSQVRTVKTDDGGRAEFGNLPAGATLKAVALVDGERLESQEFPAPTEGGIRLMLVATDKSAAARVEPNAPAAAGQVVIGGQSRIIVEPGDGAVSVYYLIDIVNNARVPVNPSAPFAFEMPAGTAAASILEGSSPKAKANGTNVLVEGPFPPGRTMVQAAAQIANTSKSLDLVQRFPANFEQLAVIVRKIGDTKLSSPQIATQQDMTAQGESFITAGGGSVPAGQPITLTIDNLPHHSPVPRWTALALTIVIVGAGVWMSRRTDSAIDEAAERRELTTRREKLFADLIRLEQDRRSGKVADERYRARRESLVASLEQVYGALDDAVAGPEPAGRAG